MQKYIEVIEGDNARCVHPLSSLEGVLRLDDGTHLMIKYMDNRFKFLIEESYETVFDFLKNEDQVSLTVNRVFEAVSENVQSILKNTEKSS